jgi:methyl-accepting chemotaxis protein
MESAISPLANQIGNMIEKLNSMNQSTVQSLTQKFGDVVTANAGTELKELAATLGQVREALSATTQSVSGSGSEMSRQLSEATSELRIVMESLVEMVKGLSHGVESDLSRTQSALQTQLASVGDNLDVLARGIKESLAEMGGQLRDSSLRAAKTFNEEIAGAVKRIENAAEVGSASLVALVDNLRAASQEATGSLADQTAGASRAIQDAVERIAASLDSASRNMLDGASEASGVISSRLLDSINELKDAARQNADQVREAVKAIAGAGHAAREDVGEAVHRVSADLDEKGQLAAAKLVSGANVVLDNLSNAFDGLNERTNSLMAALEIIENRLAVHAASLRKINDSAQSTVDAMGGAARSLKDSTALLSLAEQGLARVSEALKLSVDRLFDHMLPIQKELGRLSSEITATLDKLQQVWGRHEKRFEDVDASLGKTVETMIGNLRVNAESFSEYVVKIDKNLAGTVTQLAGNVQELSYTAEELRRAAEQFHGSNGQRR